MSGLSEGSDEAVTAGAGGAGAGATGASPCDAVDVLVVGSSNMDMTAYVTAFPLPGETIIGNSFATSYGGKGANQAVAAAKLGASTVLVTKLGDDVFGRDILQHYQRVGVSTTHCHVDPATATGVAPITVTAEGENAIIVVPGANFKLTPDDVAAADSDFQRTSVVLTQLEVPVETATAALCMGRKHGAVTVLNPAPAKADLPRDMRSSYKLCDFVTPNETELGTLTGMTVADGDEEAVVAAARVLLSWGAGGVIVTMGSKGAVLVTGSGTDKDVVRVPAAIVPRDEVVDTVGAGDAFMGSFAVFTSLGHGPAEAATRAGVVAAESVKKKGAQSSYACRSEFDAALFEVPPPVHK